MSGTINLHVGSVEDMGKRFIGAWHKLEQGIAVDETHLTFLNLETMVSTLSPKRLALLRHVRQHPANNVAALVHAGLLERDAQGIRAPTTACIPRFHWFEAGCFPLRRTAIRRPSACRPASADFLRGRKRPRPASQIGAGYVGKGLGLFNVCPQALEQPAPSPRVW